MSVLTAIERITIAVFDKQNRGKSPSILVVSPNTYNEIRLVNPSTATMFGGIQTIMLAYTRFNIYVSDDIEDFVLAEPGE